MAKVKVIVNQKFTDGKTGEKYLTGDQEMEESVAKRAASLGWVGIYPKAKAKKKKK